MSAHNTPYHMYQGPLLATDPGDAGTIVIDRYGAVVPLISGASAETRTLAVPTKAGILATVVLDTDGGGDVTLTVTDGYNHDDDTSIAFYSAGDYVTFMSVKIGSNYRWRVVGSEGSHQVTEELATDKLITNEVAYKVSNAEENGAGAVGTGIEPRTYRYTRDGVIITEIQIDLTGLLCKGDAAKDAIGLTGAAYIGRYVVATCGVVYRIEVVCLELPGEGTATITADIDLGADDEDDIAYDGGVDDVVVNTASLVAGEMASTDVPALTANDYLYLIEGDTAAATGIYDAGQYIVRLYGHPLIIA